MYHFFSFGSLRFIYLFFLVFSGLGQDENEYIDISNGHVTLKEILFEAFGQSGFANQTHGKYKLLPCSLGTFVNQSVSNIDDLKCLECPAGKFLFINAALTLGRTRRGDRWMQPPLPAPVWFLVNFFEEDFFKSTCRFQ